MMRSILYLIFELFNVLNYIIPDRFGFVLNETDLGTYSESILFSKFHLSSSKRSFHMASGTVVKKDRDMIYPTSRNNKGFTS